MLAIYLTFKIPAQRRIQRAECLQIPALIFSHLSTWRSMSQCSISAGVFPLAVARNGLSPVNPNPYNLTSHDLLSVLLIKNAFNNFILTGQLKSMVNVAYFRMFDLNSVHCIDIGVMMICQHFVNDQKRLITGP